MPRLRTNRAIAERRKVDALVLSDYTSGDWFLCLHCHKPFVPNGKQQYCRNRNCQSARLTAQYLTPEELSEATRERDLAQLISEQEQDMAYGNRLVPARYFSEGSVGHRGSLDAKPKSGDSGSFYDLNQDVRWDEAA